jgi:hypothetical protein
VVMVVVLGRGGGGGGPTIVATSSTYSIIPELTPRGWCVPWCRAHP